MFSCVFQLDMLHIWIKALFKKQLEHEESQIQKKHMYVCEIKERMSVAFLISKECYKPRMFKEIWKIA